MWGCWKKDFRGMLCCAWLWTIDFHTAGEAEFELYTQPNGYRADERNSLTDRRAHNWPPFSRDGSYVPGSGTQVSSYNSSVSSCLPHSCVPGCAVLLEVFLSMWHGLVLCESRYFCIWNLVLKGRAFSLHLPFRERLRLHSKWKLVAFLFMLYTSGLCLEQSRESFKAPLPLRDNMETTTWWFLLE